MDASTAAPDAIVAIRGLTKEYKSGLRALNGVDLDIKRGEIFALLGPNGAGKTTLISIVCGIVNGTGGSVTVDGHDIRKDFRAARGLIGLVPQELSTDAFETVWATVKFSRGLFGKAPNPVHLERILRDLSLWEKRDSKIMALSGGMKRRVLIAKALAHEPQILFLDEPTAGVDVALRRDMWKLVHRLREQGATIILTTHYIEEAEEMADRVGIIQGGRIRMVEDTRSLMKRLGRTEAHISLATPLATVPEALADYHLTLGNGGQELLYRGGDGSGGGKAKVAQLTKDLVALSIDYTAIDIRESSLEDIFVDLLEGEAA